MGDLRLAISPGAGDIVFHRPRRASRQSVLVGQARIFEYSTLLAAALYLKNEANDRRFETRGRRFA